MSKGKKPPHRKVPPELKTPEELFRKWSKRSAKGGRRRFRKLGPKVFQQLVELNEAVSAKEKRATDRRVNKFLDATRRKRLFVKSELTSPVKQEKQLKEIEKSLKLREELATRSAKRLAHYEGRQQLRGCGRGPGRGRGPSRPKVIEIDGTVYGFYPAQLVAAHLNISDVVHWTWRVKGVIPDYCVIDWRGRRWYPEPYVQYVQELGQYRSEAIVVGDRSLWKFKAYAIELWETRWKEKMPPINGIKITRQRFLVRDWHKYLPPEVKQAAEKNVTALGRSARAAKTGEAVRGFRHLRVHAPGSKTPQAPAT